MLRIAKSLLIIVAVAVVAVGATGAYFSDQAPIVGNTFTAGTLDVVLERSANKPFVVSGAYPGYTTPWEYVDIKNVGTLPFEVHLRMIKEAGTDDDLYDALYIDLWDAGEDELCDTGDEDNVLWSFGDNVGVPLSFFVHHYSRISDNDFHAQGSDHDDIVPGAYMRLCQRLRLPATASNDLQDKSVFFTERIDVVQDDGKPYVE